MALTGAEWKGAIPAVMLLAALRGTTLTPGVRGPLWALSLFCELFLAS